MEEWKKYKISDICRIKHGFAFKGIYFVDEPQKYVCVTPGNFNIKGGFKNDKPKFYNGPIPEDYVLHKDDLVVTMTDLSKNGDTLGYSALIPKNEEFIFLHNQRIGLVESISSEIDKHFLYWVMRTYDYQRYIVGHCSGSTVKHTSPSGIGSYTFKCPDIKEQKKICHLLDNLEDKIEVNRRINDNLNLRLFQEAMLLWTIGMLKNDNLEQQAQALFKSWFVDFEPFKNGEFEESEIGMIPKGWKLGTLNELGIIVGGSTPTKAKPEYYTNNGIAWLTPKDLSISQQKFTSKGEIDITQEGYESCSTKLMPKGTVLFSSRAPIGYITIAKNDICTNQGFKSVIPTFAGTAFLYCFLKKSTPEIENKATGSTFKEASGALMKSLPAIIPEKAVLDDFENLLKPLFHQQEVIEEENSFLSSLRDSLLPRLMSGEVKVNDLTQ